MWHDLAILHLGGVCARCGLKDDLAIHHKDQNWMNNDISNLEVLCFGCHKIAHNWVHQDWKDVTVKTTVYNQFKIEYQSKKDALEFNQNFRSFSDYVNWRLRDLMEQDEKQHLK
jgi:5-methylcytosine-specific restriction endonuclease McrA